MTPRTEGACGEQRGSWVDAVTALRSLVERFHAEGQDDDFVYAPRRRASPVGSQTPATSAMRPNEGASKAARER